MNREFEFVPPKSAETIFSDALSFLEKDEYRLQNGFLGLESLSEIILYRGLETLPFYSHLRTKFKGTVKSLKSGRKGRGGEAGLLKLM